MVGTCDTRDDDLEMPYHVDPQKLRTLQNYFRSTGPHTSVRAIIISYIILVRRSIKHTEKHTYIKTCTGLALLSQTHTMPESVFHSDEAGEEADETVWRGRETLADER